MKVLQKANWIEVVTYRFVEDTRKDHEEDGVHKVDDTDGDVEDIDFAVHPWPEIGNSNKVNSLNQNECNALDRPVSLSKGNEDALE